MRKGLDVEKSVISIYRRIRDLPFEAGSSKGDYREDLRHIMTYGKGSCSPKHYLLGYLYEGLGLSVVYLTYPFYWQDQPFLYPDYIRDIVRKFSLAYHLALKIYINGREIFLDASWDLPLKKAGFPVNEFVDNLEDTKNAVVPIGECIIHKSALERNGFIKKLLTEMPMIPGEEINLYNELFNEWLERVRRS